MYIGLYLLIPFFNVLYHNLKGKKEILIITLIIFMALPGIFNICNWNLTS